jgi:S1-C subfamily serine protease
MIELGRRIGIALAMTSVLAACDPAASLYRKERPRWTYNGGNYYTLDEVTRAIRAQVDEQVAAVTPLSKRVGGRALVVLPDDARLRPYLAAVVGKDRSEKDEKDHPEQAISYRLSLMTISLKGQVAALQQSKLFDTVDVVERKDPGDPDFDGHDYLVWFKVATSEGGRWYELWQVRHAPEQGAETAGIDSRALQRDRMISWVESVQQAAFSLGGAPSRGGGSVETGIVISAAGHIVTNNHGVKACHEVRVRLAGEPFPATLLAHDAENDVALLKADHVFPSSAKFRAIPIRQGESVVAVGFPLPGLIGSGSDVIVTTGIVNALTGIRNDTRFLQISAPIQPGNSGGPLLDASGLVTGIVTQSLSTVAPAESTGILAQNVNFAIKPAVVRNFLDSNAVSYATAPPGKELTTADIADAAKRFTVKVECLAAPS